MTSSSRTAWVYFCLALVWGAVCTPRLAGQDSQDNHGAQDAAVDQDSSAPLHYADQAKTPKNALVIDLQGAAAYDDNVYRDNASRVGSMVLQGGGHVGLSIERERSALSVDYTPDFLAYTNVSGYNSTNQDLRFNAKYDVTRHFELRFNDTGAYYTGLYSPSMNGYTASPAPTLGGLNDTIFTALDHNFSNEGRLDAAYQWSRRSSIDFFGSVGTRNIGGASIPELFLFNTQVYTGGFAYTYRLTADTDIGFTAMHQNLDAGISHDEIETPMLTFSWESRGGVFVGVSGGPQYLRQHDTIYYPIFTGKTVLPTSYQLRHNTDQMWAGAGTVNVGWRSDRTVIEASAQRMTADGGGIFTAVINTTETLDVRRHLERQWDLLFSAQIAQSKALGAGYGGAGLNDQVGSIKLERQLSNRLVSQFGYEAARQRVIGGFPELFNMNRNYLSLGFFYRLGQIPMGR